MASVGADCGPRRPARTGRPGPGRGRGRLGREERLELGECGVAETQGPAEWKPGRRQSGLPLPWFARGRAPKLRGSCLESRRVPRTALPRCPLSVFLFLEAVPTSMTPFAFLTFIAPLLFGISSSIRHPLPAGVSVPFSVCLSGYFSLTTFSIDLLFSFG